MWDDHHQLGPLALSYDLFVCACVGWLYQAHLRHIPTNRDVLVCNIHASVPLGGSLPTGEQASALHLSAVDTAQALREMHNLAKTLTPTVLSLPCIIAGDFNSKVGSPCYSVRVPC